MGKPEATNLLLMGSCCQIQSINLQGPDLRAASADGGCWTRRHILERWGWGHRGEFKHSSTSHPPAQKGDLSPLMFLCHTRLMCVTNLSPWNRLCISPTAREGLRSKGGM